MGCGLVDTAANANTEEEPRFQGIAVAQVVSNVDAKGLARVQIRLPWLAGTLVWARVAASMAGLNHGTYFIPQPGTEVVVAFNNGDTSDPVILGSLWNGQDRPPALLPTDPTTKRIIRTPLGHEIELDDGLSQSIKITSNSQHQVVLNPKGVKITNNSGTASVDLDAKGGVTITAAESINLKATNINLDGASVKIKSSIGTAVNGGTWCTIKGKFVFIN